MKKKQIIYSYTPLKIQLGKSKKINMEKENWEEKIKNEKLMILDLLRGQDIQIYYQICGIMQNII